MQYQAFHKLSYGLYIIATAVNGKKYGYIGNTAFQVTSEPAQLIISSHKNNFSTSKILESGSFSVSVLQKEVNTSLIGVFGFMSGAEVDKFQNVKTTAAVTGAPIVTDSVVAWFDCRVIQSFDVGSHILILGEIVENNILSNEEPLTYDYYREKYRMLAPKNAPTYVDKAKLEQENATGGVDEPIAVEEDDDHSDLQPDENGVYICNICGFRYDPAEGDPSMGIAPGTPFKDLPDDYRCPICNAGKEYFRNDE